MASCSEPAVWRPVKARSLRRTRRRLALSFEALASFLKRFSLRQFARPSTKAVCHTKLTAQKRALASDVGRAALSKTPPSPPHASHVPPKDASRVPIRMPKHKPPQATSYAGPPPQPVPALKAPQKQASTRTIAPHPLRPPLARRVVYSLSRKSARAPRQPPVTLDGRLAAPTTLKKSPGPRRAPAPRSGQPKGARCL